MYVVRNCVGSWAMPSQPTVQPRGHWRFWNGAWLACGVIFLVLAGIGYYGQFIHSGPIDIRARATVAVHLISGYLAIRAFRDGGMRDDMARIFLLICLISWVLGV